MSYSIYLFRKETKEQNSDLSFLENENSMVTFTPKQFTGLKDRLQRYGYKIQQEKENEINFIFKDEQAGIFACLSSNQLYFNSGFSEEGIFEIAMTASEFTDSGEFAKLDPQTGEWECFSNE